MVGSIELYIGPMFAGKTSTVKNKIDRASFAGIDSVIIKWKGDIRSKTNEIITHSGLGTNLSPGPGKIRISSLEKLEDAKIADTEKVIGIDEGQFFPDLILCEKWANNGKKVIIAALDCDYLKKPFKNVIELVPFAERVNKLHAICTKCHSDNASFSKRLVDSDETILIGSYKEYTVLCRSCYN